MVFVAFALGSVFGVGIVVGIMVLMRLGASLTTR